MAESNMVRDTTMAVGDRGGEEDELRKRRGKPVIGFVHGGGQKAEVKEVIPSGEVTQPRKSGGGEKDDEKEVSTERSARKIVKESQEGVKGDGDAEKDIRSSEEESLELAGSLEDKDTVEESKEEKPAAGAPDTVTKAERMLERLGRLNPKEKRREFPEEDEDEEPRMAEVMDQPEAKDAGGGGDLMSRIRLRVSVNDNGEPTFEKRGEGLVMDHFPAEDQGEEGRELDDRVEATATERTQQVQFGANFYDFYAGADSLEEEEVVQGGGRKGPSGPSLEGEVDQLLVDRPMDVKADLVEGGRGREGGELLPTGGADYVNLNGDLDLEDYYNELLDEVLGELDVGDADGRQAELGAIAAVGRLDPATVDSAMQARAGLITEEDLLADSVVPVKVELVDNEVLPDESLLRDEVRNVLLENRDDDDEDKKEEEEEDAGPPREPPGKDNGIVEPRDLPVTPLEPPGYGTKWEKTLQTKEEEKESEQAEKSTTVSTRMTAKETQKASTQKEVEKKNKMRFLKPVTQWIEHKVAGDGKVRNRDSHGAGQPERQRAGQAEQGGEPVDPECAPACHDPKDCYHLPHLTQPVCTCPPHM